MTLARIIVILIVLIITGIKIVVNALIIKSVKKGGHNMCKYCENNGDDVGINEPLMKEELCLGPMPFADIQVTIWESKLCLDIECNGDIITPAEIKIKYCPYCGEKLEDQAN